MYQTIQLHWSPTFEKEIQEVYRMLKDQENKIFDLAWHDKYNNNSIMNIIEKHIKLGQIFVEKYNDDVAGMVMLTDPRTFGDLIITVDVHAVIRKKYWGKPSRDILRDIKQYLDKNFKIKKMIASVPQCGYGVIKLLKDLGFKHEGTLKQACLYPDKNNKPKFYDKLIYSSTRGDL